MIGFCQQSFCVETTSDNVLAGSVFSKHMATEQEKTIINNFTCIRFPFQATMSELARMISFYNCLTSHRIRSAVVPYFNYTIYFLLLNTTVYIIVPPLWPIMICTEQFFCFSLIFGCSSMQCLFFSSFSAYVKYFCCIKSYIACVAGPVINSHLSNPVELQATAVAKMQKWN